MKTENIVLKSIAAMRIASDLPLGALPQISIVSAAPPPDGQGIATGLLLETGQRVFVVLRTTAGRPQILGVWSTLALAIGHQANAQALAAMLGTLPPARRPELLDLMKAALDAGEADTSAIDRYADAHGIPRLATHLAAARAEVEARSSLMAMPTPSDSVN